MATEATNGLRLRDTDIGWTLEELWVFDVQCEHGEAQLVEPGQQQPFRFGTVFVGDRPLSHQARLALVRAALLTPFPVSPRG